MIKAVRLAALGTGLALAAVAVFFFTSRPTTAYDSSPGNTPTAHCFSAYDRWAGTTSSYVTRTGGDLQALHRSNPYAGVNFAGGPSADFGVMECARVIRGDEHKAQAAALGGITVFLLALIPTRRSATPTTVIKS